MENNKSESYNHPKEIVDLAWNNTNEELVKKGYKIWAVTYDNVCINIPIL